MLPKGMVIPWPVDAPTSTSHDGKRKAEEMSAAEDEAAYLRRRERDQQRAAERNARNQQRRWHQGKGYGGALAAPQPQPYG